MAKLFFVEFIHDRVEFFENFETSLRDAGFDDTTVFGLALASDELTFFHPVKQAGHVRVARDHAVTDALAGQALRTRAAQYAKDVVLGGGKTVGLDKEFGVLRESVGETQERNEEFGFEAWDERLVVLRRLHTNEYSRDNDYCQEERK